MDRAKPTQSTKQAKSAAKSAKQGSSSKAPPSKPAGSWHTFLLAAASSLMLWAALPPLGWWPLAWIAPVPWLWLIQAPRMRGRWPYLAIWTAAFLHWLAVMQGVRLAHPILYAGWIALSWYLAFYPLLFVVIARKAVLRARVPMVIAAPTVWVALELVRGYAITGFSAALLGHTQYRQTLLIQLSDTLGGYGVSFVVMFLAAALASGLPWLRWFPALAGASPLAEEATNMPVPGNAWRVATLVAAGLVLAGSLGYGAYRLNEQTQQMAQQRAKAEPVQIALLQENVATIFDYDRQRSIDTFARYLRLAESAVDRNAKLDLVVWPESSFNSVSPIFEFGPAAHPPPEAGISEEDFQYRREQMERAAPLKARGAAYRLHEQVAMLVGTDAFLFNEHDEHFNAAALYSPQGELLGQYGKMHRVMFGEYIPLGDQFPWIYSLTPMGSGLTAGKRPEVFDVKGVKLAPSICFESVMPHLISGQVRELAQRGETPHVLVNITNDGWFKSSSILDLHHICSVFRAVENRRPMLVAANIGITAEIDAAGRVQQQLPRREVGFLLANVYPTAAPLSLYTRWGDWFAITCLLGSLVALAIAPFRPSTG